jgi:hypothetical protein
MSTALVLVVVRCPLVPRWALRKQRAGGQGGQLP